MSFGDPERRALRVHAKRLDVFAFEHGQTRRRRYENADGRRWRSTRVRTSTPQPSRSSSRGTAVHDSFEDPQVDRGRAAPVSPACRPTSAAMNAGVSVMGCDGVTARRRRVSGIVSSSAGRRSRIGTLIRSVGAPFVPCRRGTGRFDESGRSLCRLSKPMMVSTLRCGQQRRRSGPTLVGREPGRQHEPMRPPVSSSVSARSTNIWYRLMWPRALMPVHAGAAKERAFSAAHRARKHVPRRIAKHGVEAGVRRAAGRARRNTPPETRTSSGRNAVLRAMSAGLVQQRCRQRSGKCRMRPVRILSASDAKTRRHRAPVAGPATSSMHTTDPQSSSIRVGHAQRSSRSPSRARRRLCRRAFPQAIGAPPPPARATSSRSASANSGISARDDAGPAGPAADATRSAGDAPSRLSPHRR